MNNKLEFTQKLVYEAKDFILQKIQSGVHVDTKSARNDFVTNVDQAVETFLTNAINDKYENQNFITEEGMVENSNQGEVWIIDPIDGTTNFIYQKQYFAISIAYYEDAKPVFGIVYDVMADEMFVGIHGEGAYLNGKKLEMLDQDETINDVIYSGGLSFSKYFNEDPIAFNSKIIAHRNLGSAAIEICHIASGRLHVYFARTLNLWDVGAALIILAEVGGHWRFGHEIDSLNLQNNKALFLGASSTNIYNYMDGILKPEVI
ncbi:MAG TPA: inositol monophosphatase family protein [Erysipelothrix sp.]